MNKTDFENKYPTWFFRHMIMSTFIKPQTKISVLYNGKEYKNGIIPASWGPAKMILLSNLYNIKNGCWSMYYTLTKNLDRPDNIFDGHFWLFDHLNYTKPREYINE